MLQKISDWNNAYANGANIAGSHIWPDAWVAPAQAYRERMVSSGRAKLGTAYGDDQRQSYDLFLPESTPKGLVVYVHGGYWMAFDNSTWSHFAEASVERGYAVAMPSYRLCPTVRIRDITQDIATAITHAGSQVEGPIHLTGHSAGGHLVTRMATTTAPLSDVIQKRLVNIVSIAGVHDLRPLMRTDMMDTLKLDLSEAVGESPALLQPIDGIRLTTWVGGAERAEFRRQSSLLANIWTGLGAATEYVEEADRHHFNIIDGLKDPDHAIVEALLRP